MDALRPSPTHPARRRNAGQTVTIKVDETTLRVYDQHDHLINTVPRISCKEVAGHKGYGHTTNRKIRYALSPINGNDPSPIVWNQADMRSRCHVIAEIPDRVV